MSDEPIFDALVEEFGKKLIPHPFAPVVFTDGTKPTDYVTPGPHTPSNPVVPQTSEIPVQRPVVPVQTEPFDMRHEPPDDVCGFEYTDDNGIVVCALPRGHEFAGPPGLPRHNGWQR